MHLAVAHGLSVAQPHLITLSTSIGARATPSDIVTGSSDLEASSFSQPKFVGASPGVSFSNAAFHTDSWKCARLTFCSNTSYVGGRDFSIGEPVTFLFAVLPIHTSYLVEDILSLLAHIHSTLQQTARPQVILRPLASQYYPSLEVCSLIKSTLTVFAFPIIIIIKCMCSRCRRDDIHVCFAYASPQRMPHMYDHKTVSLKYII